MTILVFGVILIFLLGYLITSLIDDNLFFLEKISTGFLISTGITTFTAFIANLFGIRFTLDAMSVLFLSLTLFSIVLNIAFKKNKFKFHNIQINLKNNRIELLLVALVLATFVTSFISDIYWPVRDWDALTLYDFRGKFFASTGSMTEIFKIHRYYIGYPLYTSVLHALVYLTGSGNNPLFLYSFIYLAFISSIYFQMRLLSNSKIAALFTFIVSYSFEIFDHSMLAYTNLPYTVFLITGYLYLINYIKYKKLSSLVLSGILVGLSGWIRSSDPFWIPAFLYIVVDSLVTKRYKIMLLFIVLVLSFRIPWTIFVNDFSKNYTITSSNNLGSILSTSINTYIERFFKVIPYVWLNVVKPQIATYSLLAISLLIKLKEKNHVLNAIKLIVIANLGIIIAGVYFYSIVYEKWEVIGNSVTRMSIFMTPLILIQVSYIIYLLFFEKKYKFR